MPASLFRMRSLWMTEFVSWHLLYASFLIEPRMISKQIILTLLAGFLLAAADASTRIEAKFPKAIGEEVRLMTYVDLLSHKIAEVDAQTVDADGQFLMEPELEKPQLMFFRYRHGRRFIYLEPGQTYTIHFDIAAPDEQEGAFRSLHPLHQGFQMKVIYPGPEDHLHDRVSQMDNMVADYLETHVMHRPRANHRESLRQFSILADTLPADTDSPYFCAYKRYYIAYLESTLHIRSFRNMVEEYILDQPILYDNPMYMDVFDALFRNYVFTGSRFIMRRDLHAAVNRDASYQALMDALGKDTLLMHDRLRELVMLISLQEMFGISEYDQDQVVHVLQETAAHGKFSEHRRMASSILYQQKRLKPGFSAPELLLKEGDEVIFDLEKERGQYVYLFFWASWCPVSMSEFSPMADIAGDFSDDLSVVGIMVDEDRDASLMSAGAGDGGLPFRLFHYGGDYRMLDRYDIKTIPQYMLIDPQGDLYEYPFAAPSSGISDRLRRIISR